MRFSVRAFILVLCLLIGTFSFLPSYASAQGSYPATPTATHPYVNPYNVPNTDPNVPANQNTRVQTLMIDILSSSMCLLIGVDPANQNKPCLNVNPQTGKIGYVSTSYDENGQPRAGGILGASTTLISVLYTPTISSSQYGAYLAKNFGIVKPAYAQEEGYGFNGLDSILVLWTSVRNMAYFLLMLAFVLIGLGIMLRVKVDPRTVMTLQNQIPRIIICILLVTFSYPIAGLLIDTMWITTYIGINVITTSAGNQIIIPGDDSLPDNDANKVDRPLGESASANLLTMPVAYVNQVFRSPDDPASGRDNIDSGIGHITDEVSYSIGSFLEEIVRQLTGVENESCVGWSGIQLGACLADVLGWIATILLWLIILITLLRTLFSVWFTLIKAYTYVIIYTLAAPLFIVMGLLPGSPLGFEKWIRSMGANLAPFPLTAWLFVLGRVFIELFSQAGTDRFIPPLVGNPNILGLLGWIIAFGLILMSPTLLTTMQETLKVPGNKHGGAAIGGAIAAGAAAPKALAGGIWKKAWQKGDQHQDAGILRRWAAGTKPVAKDDQVGTPGHPGRVVNTIRKWRAKLNKYDGGKRRA